MPTRPANERRRDFKEVNLGFSDEAARAEAKALPLSADATTIMTVNF